MTVEAKLALSKTIRALRGRLLADLHDSTETVYRLTARAQDAGLSEAARAKRARLDAWLDEQVRGESGNGKMLRTRADFRREVEKQAAYTLLNRIVILRLMEAMRMRLPAVATGGWESRGYKDFRSLAPALVRGDESEGYAFLLQLVFEDLAVDLPGLYGSAGVADLVPVGAATLRHVIESLDDPALESCWTDDMTLGWIYQYWNDPEREALDEKLNAGGKVEPHEIASKTHMFAERYMVNWLLQNSLGPMCLAMCRKHGWTADCERRLPGESVGWGEERTPTSREATSDLALGFVPQPNLQPAFYFLPGIAFSMIGQEFLARVHRYRSVLGGKGSSVYPEDLAKALISMNSTASQEIMEALNPEIGFEVGDVNRLPLFSVPGCNSIFACIENCFSEHESHREPPVEFKKPGPSPWRHAQARAQTAVDRPEGAPLPAYQPKYDPEPPTDHLSFALGVVLGRFGPSGEGILEPARDDFSDAWINNHRWSERTLRVLLADHLNPALIRIEGELDDLRAAREGADRKVARDAEQRLDQILRWREELAGFAAAVEQCAEKGPPPTDSKCPPREIDARYAPDLEDGVMINSAALWPLLEPQWKDPKEWWKELAAAKGKKDYDWSHLAMRYWPTRVDAKCREDLSLGVAHGCFWRYHTSRAWAWELRLQDEIDAGFRIEEVPYRGDSGHEAHRAAFLEEHAEAVLAAVEKEVLRQRRKQKQPQAELRLLETGLWTRNPDLCCQLELRLTERQQVEFCLLAPDELQARAAFEGEHPELARQRKALIASLNPREDLFANTENQLRTTENTDEHGNGQVESVA